MKIIKIIILLFASLTGFYFNIALTSCKEEKKPVALKTSLYKQTEAQGITIAKLPLDLKDEYLTFIKFDSSIYKPRLLHSVKYGRKVMGAAEITEKAGAVGVINASYFDENNHPLGYIKINGKTINGYIAEPIIYSGIAEIKDGKLLIMHRDNFNKSLATEAFQAGPRLISKGLRTNGLENTVDYREKSLRSGIAVNKKGDFIIFKTTSTIANWEQITQTILNNPELGITEAMNLDGGSSSQIYIHSQGFEFNEGGMTQVPVFIGFFKI